MLQVDFPTSSPFVTSVGGTSLAIGPFNNYEFETSWGTLLDPLASSGTAWQYTPPGLYPEYYDGSSGGGVSTAFTQPFYQAGVVPDSLATALPDGTTSPVPMRVVPDVSALADPSTGLLVGQTTLQPDGTTYAFSLSRIGGTSLACPTFAGIQADAQQAAGHVLGFANPAIYRRYGTDAFHDVTDHPLGPLPWPRSATTTPTRIPRRARSSRTCARSASTAKAPPHCLPWRATTIPPASGRPITTSSRSVVLER